MDLFEGMELQALAELDLAPPHIRLLASKLLSLGLSTIEANFHLKKASEKELVELESVMNLLAKSSRNEHLTFVVMPGNHYSVLVCKLLLDKLNLVVLDDATSFTSFTNLEVKHGAIFKISGSGNNRRVVYKRLGFTNVLVRLKL